MPDILGPGVAEAVLAGIESLLGGLAVEDEDLSFPEKSSTPTLLLTLEATDLSL